MIGTNGDSLGIYQLQKLNQELEEENKKLKEHKRENELLLKRHTRLFKECTKLEEKIHELEEENKRLYKIIDKYEEDELITENPHIKREIIDKVIDYRLQQLNQQ